MQNLKAFLLPMLFISTTLFADVSGNWKGPGKAWDSDGFKTDCQEIQITIVETVDQLLLKDIRWSCTDAANTYEDFQFQIKNQELFKNEKKVGLVNSTGFKVTSDSIGIPLTFTMTRQLDGTILYHEDWKGKDSVFHVEGILKK